jgi:hypothetical protein
VRIKFIEPSTLTESKEATSRVSSRTTPEPFVELEPEKKEVVEVSPPDEDCKEQETERASEHTRAAAVFMGTPYLKGQRRNVTTAGKAATTARATSWIAMNGTTPR